MSHKQAINVIIEDSDPSRRAEAHLVLGRRAAHRQDNATAKQHFRKATELAPELLGARAELLGLEGVAAHNRPKNLPTTFFRWLTQRGQA